MNSKTKTMVGIGLFTAIVVVLQLLGGGIHIGIFSITLVLVPIVVGSAVYSWKAGAFLGLAFGLTVLLSGDAAPFLAIDALATVGVVLTKGILCGLFAGLVYKLLQKCNRYVAVVAAAITCPIVNTGVFLLGCWLFFMPAIEAWAVEYGYADATTYMFLGLAGANFIVELVTNIILAPVIVRLIKIGQK